MDYSFNQIVETVGREVLARCPIVAGLAIIENGYEETGKIEAVAPADFLTREKELLLIARQLLPRLPLERLDLLIVDEIGKNVSGSGMDTNVIGRKFNESEAAPDEFPKVRRIAVRGLTEITHGNALGIGLADFCTRRAIDEIDFSALKINCVTSCRTAVGQLPLAFDTDRQMIEYRIDDDRPDGSAPQPHRLDSQHPRAERAGVFGGAVGRAASPRACRNHLAAARLPLRCRGQSAGRGDSCPGADRHSGVRPDGARPGRIRADPKTAGDCPNFCAVLGAKWGCPLLRGGFRIGSSLAAASSQRRAC